MASILGAIARHDADIVVLKMSRQSGKNYISERVEAAMLDAYQGAGGEGGKAAPTMEPQARVSRRRLQARMRQLVSGRGRHHLRKMLRTDEEGIAFGGARWWFGSGEPDANVVGKTASIALEFDEAQDFDQEMHDKSYSPMAASTAAARIYYGTPWTDFDLLHVMTEEARRREKRDGRRRYYAVPWDRVAEELPAYGQFVEAEMARLGHTAETPHPTIRTQYELHELEGQGRLFNPRQLDLLQGDHPRLDGPRAADTYVAGLDVGGADLSGSGDPDETVLTIARAQFPGRGRRDQPTAHIVAQYHWRGSSHEGLRAEVLDHLRRWRVTYVSVDATGIGEPLAGFLEEQLGERHVEAVKFTEGTKSSIGYDMVAAVNNAQLRIWEPDGADHGALMHQCRMARAEFRPNGTMRWYVDEREGHDDRLVSLALANRAAQRGKPRVARMR